MSVAALHFLPGGGRLCRIASPEPVLPFGYRIVPCDVYERMLAALDAQAAPRAGREVPEPVFRPLVVPPDVPVTGLYGGGWAGHRGETATVADLHGPPTRGPLTADIVEACHRFGFSDREEVANNIRVAERAWAAGQSEDDVIALVMHGADLSRVGV